MNNLERRRMPTVRAGNRRHEALRLRPRAQSPTGANLSGGKGITVPTEQIDLGAMQHKTAVFRP
jgi:hypothetical protein